MGLKYAVKAGRFEHDPTSKKVKVRKEKGELSIGTVNQMSCRTLRVRLTSLGWTSIINLS